jgi:hypothetical protein
MLEMFRWLFRIALGFFAVKLAATYKSPESKVKPFPDKPTRKPGKEHTGRTKS